MLDAPQRLNILCIFPGPTQRPDSVDFEDRFAMLSKHFNGEIYSWTSNKEYCDYKIGSFRFKAYFSRKIKASKLTKAMHIIKSAYSYNKREGVDLIICYEPVFTGFLGALLRIAFGCKLIVELNNSNFAEAILLEVGDTFKGRLKVLVFKILRAFTLYFADGIKLLTENQRINLEDKYQKKHVFCFHDYVPTHFFTTAEKRMDSYILFVGYPFYRKGIDILVQAFEAIKDEFPEFELLLIGHRLTEEAHKRLAGWDKRIKFVKPMEYEKLRDYFLNCYCFVLPSREEGMGRVVLEAMASAKPVVGANVGGIPGLISHGVNGLLFEREDVNDLIMQLRRVLSDNNLAVRMGKEGEKYIRANYSSEKYVEYFSNMVHTVCGIPNP